MSSHQSMDESTGTPAPPQQTLSQRRAAFAIERVGAVKDEGYAQAFRSYASSLPSMIQMNGFGQALAFIHSKKDPAYKALYGLVSDWLVMDDQPYANQHDVLGGVTRMGMSRYRLAQTEALALLEWVKRFASAFIEAKKDGDEPPDGVEA